MEKLAGSFCLYHADEAKSQSSQTSATFRQIQRPKRLQLFFVVVVVVLKSFLTELVLHEMNVKPHRESILTVMMTSKATLEYLSATLSD